MPKASTTITVATQGGTVYLDVDVSANGAPTVHVGWNSASDELQLLPDDKTLKVRIFLDGSAGEIYFQDGRIAATVGIKSTDALQVEASAEVQMAHAISYGMSSIYTTAEEVLATPRVGLSEVAI